MPVDGTESPTICCSAGSLVFRWTHHPPFRAMSPANGSASGSRNASAGPGSSAGCARAALWGERSWISRSCRPCLPATLVRVRNPEMVAWSMAELQGIGVPGNRRIGPNWPISSQRIGATLLHLLLAARKAPSVGLFSTACWFRRICPIVIGILDFNRCAAGEISGSDNRVCRRLAMLRSLSLSGAVDT